MPRRAQHGAAGRARAAGAAGGGVEWLRQRVQQGTRGSGDPGAAGAGTLLGRGLCCFGWKGMGVVGMFLVGNGIA